MADEDKTTIVDSGDEAAEESKAASSPGKKKILMLAGVGVGAIVVGVLLTIFVLKPMMSSDSATEGEQVEESQDKHAAKKVEKKKEHKKPSKKEGHGNESGSQIYSVTDIVVNPAGSGGGRFLSVSFAFELESQYMVSTFEEREPIIRDALITILSSKTVAQLTDPKQKEVVRYLIKKRISKLMDTQELAGVYYTDFVLQ